jgi:hypothetical protein
MGWGVLGLFWHLGARELENDLRRNQTITGATHSIQIRQRGVEMLERQNQALILLLAAEIIGIGIIIKCGSWGVAALVWRWA